MDTWHFLQEMVSRSHLVVFHLPAPLSPCPGTIKAPCALTYPNPYQQLWVGGNRAHSWRWHRGSSPWPAWWCHSSGSSPGSPGCSHCRGSHSSGPMRDAVEMHCAFYSSHGDPVATHMQSPSRRSLSPTSQRHLECNKVENVYWEYSLLWEGT